MSRSRALLAPFAGLALIATTSMLGCAASCPPAPPGTAEASSTPSPDDMASAAAALERFHAAAAKADEEGYFGLFADGGVFLGTDAKERWTVPQFRAYAHPRFASGKSWSFKSTRREISVRGDTAWFDEELDTPNLGPARGSGVLVRANKAAEWKVAQYNLSIPIPNERFADVKKVIEAK